MSKQTFLVDVNKCTGCMLCTIACKDEHVGNNYAPWAKPQPEGGHFWMRVTSLERGEIPRVRVTHLPVLCQHCGNAACMKVCPERSIKRRDDGLVWIDPATCTGCGLCQAACPYGVIYMNNDLHLAQKCTGCAHRVDAGALPRCVDICPHDAILFGSDAEIAADGGGEVYHPEYLAQPIVRWKGLPTPWIAGMVIDEASDEVIADVAVTAYDLFDDRTVSVKSDEFGDFWLRGVGKDRKFKLEFTKQGYRTSTVIVTTVDDQDLGRIALVRTG